MGARPSATVQVDPTGDAQESEAAVDVSVLIPTLNEERHVEALVERLQAQEYDGALEFLFIDGGSTDRTRSLLDRAAAGDERVVVLDNPMVGIPFALNIGLRRARGGYVARMDAHTVYPKDYLARGVARLQRGDVEWVSGPQLAMGTDAGSSVVALALSTRLGIGGASFRHETAREIDVDAGYTGVWRAAALRRHGGWDERWAVNEDGELAARVLAEGGRIVCIPEMSAQYVPRNSLRSLARQYWRYGQYRAKTSRAHPESMRRSHLLPPALVLVLASACLPRRRASRLPRLAAMGGYFAALAGTAYSKRHEGRSAAGIPVALATMHLAWGAGFLVGCVRFGPPVLAVRGLVRGRR
jgi:succinoglycan biosynthesis protein ExoA